MYILLVEILVSEYRIIKRNHLLIRTMKKKRVFFSGCNGQCWIRKKRLTFLKQATLDSNINLCQVLQWKWSWDKKTHMKMYEIRFMSSCPWTWSEATGKFFLTPVCHMSLDILLLYWSNMMTNATGLQFERVSPWSSWWKADRYGTGVVAESFSVWNKGKEGDFLKPHSYSK